MFCFFPAPGLTRTVWVVQLLGSGSTGRRLNFFSTFLLASAMVVAPIQVSQCEDNPEQPDVAMPENPFAGIGVGSGAGGGHVFGPREGGPRARAAIRGGGSKDSESAVNLALEWLAKHQEPDGHWDTVKYGAQDTGKCDTAATGLATLAFLGAGHTDTRGQWKDNVKRATEWMIKQQTEKGCIMPGINGKEVSYGPGYHHGVCALALAECAGMSNSPHIKTAAQKAVNYSVNDHQAGKDTDKGGWRYMPKTPGDTSVSGWFIMQLKSARLAGLNVPQEGFQGAIAFLDSVEEKGQAGDLRYRHRYKYTPAKRESAPVTTLIGCTARLFLGTPPQDLEPAVTWAINTNKVPAWGEKGESVDWYYWYFGTMMAFQIGGEVWPKWNNAMRDTLVENQCKDDDDKGSWPATGQYANYGRVYSTASGALCLEVYYRYNRFSGPAAAKP